MTTFWIIFLCVIYYFISRIVGNFLFNLVSDRPIKYHGDGSSILFAIWCPLVGEGGGAIYFLIVGIGFLTNFINERTHNLAMAVRKRIGLR